MARLIYIKRREQQITEINYGFLYNWYVAANKHTIKSGYLYNWYAVDPTGTGTNIAASGWHVPTVSDFQTLLDYGGANGDYSENNSVANKFKATYGWGVVGTNTLGFSAKASGFRDYGGLYAYSQGDYFEMFRMVLADYDIAGVYAGMIYSYYSNSFALVQDVDRLSGYSIRLVKDSTTLLPGNVGTYVGNDGVEYKTIRIGTQEWMSENLAETKYRDGSNIVEVQDPTAWSGLTTGARCSYNNIPTNAIIDTNIANTGWRVATGDLDSSPYSGDWGILLKYLDPTTTSSFSTIAGAKIKEQGLNWWNADNGTNEALFNARGSGIRYGDGGFGESKDVLYLWAKSRWEIYYPSMPSVSLLRDTKMLDVPVSGQGCSQVTKNAGASIRLIKNSTTLSNGQTGTYTGNDGKVYRTICIGTQEWLADNLSETKYRNGDWIDGFNGGVYTPIDDSTWAGLTSGALCVFSNDLSYL